MGEAEIEEQIKLAIMGNILPDGTFDVEKFKQEMEKQEKNIISQDENTITVEIGENRVVIDIKKGEIEEIKKLQDIISVVSEITPKNEIISPSKQIKIVAQNEKYGIQSITMPNNEVVNSNEVTFKVPTDGEYKFIIVDKNGKSKTETIEISNIKETFDIELSNTDLTYLKNPPNSYLEIADSMYHDFVNNDLILFASFYQRNSTEYGKTTMSARGSVPENVSGFSKLNVEYGWLPGRMNPSSSGYGGSPSFVVESKGVKSVLYENSSGYVEVLSVAVGDPGSRYYLRCRSGGWISYPSSGCVCITKVWLSL